VGELVTQRHALAAHGIAAADLGAIIAAACLAHDLGNPPFGHSGEDAIRAWFRDSDAGQSALEGLDPTQRQDFLRFEGNAQGFRILTRLQSPGNEGGMQLTLATLATFSKYPCASHLTGDVPTGVGFKKHGFFFDDQICFRGIAEAVGLDAAQVDMPAWFRHPLAWLLEAADDICYSIIDIEDGFREGRLPLSLAMELLIELVADKRRTGQRVLAPKGDKERVEYLRALAINDVVEQVFECFADNEPRFLEARMEQSIVDQIESAPALEALKTVAQDQLYFSRSVVEIATAGYQVLGGLLNVFVPAVEEVAACGDRAASRNRMLVKLIPEQFIGPNRVPLSDPYRRLLGLTDFVSGMTDSYAVSLYKMITGISLPER
jgi:dGTPase